MYICVLNVQAGLQYHTSTTTQYYLQCVSQYMSLCFLDIYHYIKYNYIYIHYINTICMPPFVSLYIHKHI